MKKDFEKKFKLPKEVTAVIEKNTLKLRLGQKESSKSFNAKEMAVTVEENEVVLRPKRNKKTAKAVINAFYSHIKNLARGLESPFVYKLEVVFSHFPITVSQKGSVIEISNVGGSKRNRQARIIGSTTVEIKGKEITVKGLHREHAGQTAANLEQSSRVKGKDTRVFQDGIYITEKPKTMVN